jgi:hypothetical protein
MNDKITTYVAGKKWYWYLLVWAFCIYVLVVSFGFNPNTNPSPILQALYMVQFGVHEIAHVAAAFLPQIMTAAAGSMSELLLTGTFIGVSLYYKSYFAVVFSSVWFMLACQSVGMYMSDARSMRLQLVSVGDKAVHDWHFIFGQLGWLQADTAIGMAFKVFGVMVGLVGLSFGLYLLIRMMVYKKPVEASRVTPTPLAQAMKADPLDAIQKAREAQFKDLDDKK